MSRITKLLKSMGNHSDEVAGELLMNGCFGERKCSDNCPVVNYVYKKLPNLSKGLEMTSSSELTWDDVQTLDPFVPRPVAEFVRLFDEGTRYQFLNSRYLPKGK